MNLDRSAFLKALVGLAVVPKSIPFPVDDAAGGYLVPAEELELRLVERTYRVMVSDELLADVTPEVLQEVQRRMAHAMAVNLDRHIRLGHGERV